MAIADFSMKQLIEAGVHFGHKTKRWNPAMAPYIYGVRNNTHIIDLGQTAPMLHSALKAAHDIASSNGKILFVGTKRQASSIIAETAKSCGQYYINERWLGGLLTNWNTIQASITRLKKLEEILDGGDVVGFTKKELLNMDRQRGKLEKSLGGIKNMKGRPDLIFIIDTTKEELAVKEALNLSIPTVGIIDTNASTSHITFPVPGNDDATRAIRLYCDLMAQTITNARQHIVQSEENQQKIQENAGSGAAKKAGTAKPEENVKKAS